MSEHGILCRFTQYNPEFCSEKALYFVRDGEDGTLKPFCSNCDIGSLGEVIFLEEGIDEYIIQEIQNG